VDRDLQQLIESSIDSVWTLEVLLLLHAARERSWTVRALTDDLRSSELVITQSTAILRTAGLIIEEADGAVRYRPAAPNMDALVARLGEEYRSRPATVRRAIVAPQNTKLQSFSDAFLLRKPKNE
jgi:hypothetical protein